MSDEQLVISVDSQELNSMNICPERWRMEFGEHWRPNTKAVSMEKGSIMHAMLAHWYRSHMDWVDKKGIFHKARLKPEQQNDIVLECLQLGKVMMTNVPALTPEEWDETVERVFKEYLLKWQYDYWEILSVESPFTKVLYESPKLRIDYTGITDLIVRDPKRGKMVIDTKTEQRKSQPEVLNNQFIGYHFASDYLPVIINKIGWQKDSTPLEQRIRRIELKFNEDMVLEWKNDAIKQVIESIGWMKQLDEGKRLSKRRSSCGTDNFGCMYRSVCREPASVREHILTVNFKKKIWDPHKVEEVKAELVEA